ncbi:MAG: NYN domain-containing protein [Acidobacteria bacterium]|nr:NYN domain-containing protein [Acidobacteriota bacterium]
MFVDVQNMFYGAREKNARLDFEALLAAASHDRQLVRAVAYLVEAREIDQSAFIHLLQAKAYEVKRKPLRIRADRTMKGNWDLEMALDALSTAEHLDVVVLVTGDGDFVPLVRQLKLKGCRVEVFGFPRSTAPDLREAADKFVPITRRLLRPLTPERRPRSAATETGPQAEETPAAGEAPVPVVHS